MKYQRKKTSALVFLVTFVYMLMQTRCWIGFGGILMLSHALVFVFLILAAFMGWVSYEFKFRNVFLGTVYLIAWTYIYNGLNGNLTFLILSALPALNIFLVLCIPDEDKNDLLSAWIKWFGWIIMIALPLYVLSFVMTLPSFGILQADYDGKVTDILFTNHIFLIKPLDSSYTISRFNGPLIEPGDIGCLGTFLLFAAQYNFRKYKYLWAVAAGVFASFSLAGWLMSIVGYVMIMYTRHSISLKSIGIATFFFITVLLYGLYYNGGNNIVNEIIISRLMNDDLSGSSRVSEECEVLFLALIFSGDWNLILHGYGLELAGEVSRGAGYMQFVVLHGFLGIIYMLVPYIYMIFVVHRRNARYASLFFIIAILYLLQRAELYWICFVVPHVFGTILDDLNHNRIIVSGGVKVSWLTTRAH